MRRYKPAPVEQTPLPSVDLGHEPLRPKKKNSPQPGGNRGRREYRPRFLGEVVPVPRDRMGQELRMEPFAVLQTVWGEHFVFDYRRKINDNVVFRGSKRECVVEMVRLAQRSSPTGPT